MLIFDRKLKEERDYWLRVMQYADEPASLLPDYALEEGGAPRHEGIETLLGAELCGELRQLTNDSPLLLCTALLSALKLCLWRHTGRRRLVVGTPRCGVNEEPGVVPIVETLDDEMTFRQLLLSLRSRLADAYEHQAYPHERLLQDLHPDAPALREALFHVALRLDGFHTPFPPGLRRDLTFDFSASQGQLRLQLEYNARLYRRDCVSAFLQQYLHALAHAVADTTRKLSEIEIASEDEDATLITGAEQPGTSEIEFIFRQFEARARAMPDKLAVICGDQRWTYEELNRRANRAAHRLIAGGVGPEVCVASHVPHTALALVSLLGILKAGGAYVPLEWRGPGERLAFVLNDARIKVAVCVGEPPEELGSRGVSVIRIDVDPAGECLLETDPGVALSAENLAYVLYTSGSTGKPRGVMGIHAELAPHCASARGCFRLSSDDVFLQSGALQFDASLEQILGPLTAGATLVLNGAEMFSTSDCRADIERHSVTVINLTPAYWQQLAREWDNLYRASRLRLVIVGGDEVTVESVGVNRLSALGRAQLLNAYGPTETTITATLFDVSPDFGTDSARPARVPIGTPLPGRTAYILDRFGQQAPACMPGELHLAGVGLTRGYVGLPDLTAKRFVPNPFSGLPGDRMYRTGDVARKLPDGSIEFLGRLDRQVKVRGYRIELGEIEAALASHPVVGQVVVQLRGGAGGETRLIAYLVPRAGQTLNPSELRRFLDGKVPTYMVPTAFVSLCEMPLTSTGKLDANALPEPDEARRPAADGDLSLTPFEEVLAQLWAGLLRAERLSPEDDFFALGGHSLLAMQLLSRVETTFKVGFTLRAIFDTPTLRGMARAIETATRAKAAVTRPHLVRASTFADLPMSSGQQRLWFLHQLAPTDALYNCSVALRLSGPLAVAPLARALEEIVRRHGALRTIFPSRDGVPSQRVLDARPLDVPVLDLRGQGREAAESDVRALAHAEAARPFDLSGGTLFRARLLRLDEEEYVLLLTMHHIVSDAWSLQIFSRELSTLYEAFAVGRPSPLSEPPPQYADFALTQRAWLESDAVEPLLNYWKGKLSGDLPWLNLSGGTLAHRRARAQGEVRTFSVPAHVAATLAKRAHAERATLFMLLLTAFKALLHQRTGQEDLLVGTPTAGRGWPGTEDVIGFFTNVLPLRTNLGGDPTLSELLARVRETTLAAYAHQDLPFEKIVEAVQPTRVSGRDPLVQIAFAYHEEPPRSFTLSGLNVKPFEFGAESSKLDLTLVIQKTAAGLEGSLEYDADVVGREAAERLIEGLLDILRALADAPGCRLSALAHAREVSLKEVEADRPESPTGASDLTKNQQLIWLGQKMQPDVPFYNATMTFTLPGAIDPGLFEQAFQSVVDGADALRTVIEEVDGTPRQRVLPYIAANVRRLDLSAEPDSLAAVHAWARAHFAAAFKMSERLFASALVKISPDAFVWCLCQHHIIADAWSFSLIYQRVAAAYARLLAGELPDAETSHPQYSDYVEYERRVRQSRQGRDAEEYWARKVAEPVESAAFYGVEPQRLQGTHIHRVTRELGRERTMRLKHLAAREEVFSLTLDLSLFNVLATVLFAYVHRATGNRHLSVGSPFHARPSAAFKQTVGFFMEACPLRVSVEDGDTFFALNKKVVAETIRSFRHYPYATPNPPGSKSWEVMLNYHHLHFPDFQGAPVAAEWLHSGHGNESLTVQVHDFSAAENLSLSFDFREGSFDADKREEAIGHFLRLLDAYLDSGDQRVRAVEVVSGDERARLLDNAGLGAASDEAHTTVQLLVAEQAARTPQAVAVSVGDENFTLRHLNDEANRLARYLRAQGVRPEVVVGVCFERSAELVVAILAVLKAGGAYLPLDPAYPSERLCLALADAGAKLVLAGHDAAVKFASDGHLRIIAPADDAEEIGRFSAEDFDGGASPDNLAYVIYTSGSTGRPKGVMVHHRGLLNLLRWFISDFNINGDDCFLLASAPTFDLTQKNLLAPLMKGARLHIPPGGYSPRGLLQQIADQRVTILNCTPSAFYPLVEEAGGEHLGSLATLRHLFLGGEPITASRLRRWLESPACAAIVVNTYGPTECSDISLFHAASDPSRYFTEPFPIGRPIKNVHLLLLDEELRLVPEGCAGETCVGGTGVAYGYCADAKLTAEKFVPDPFSRVPGARLYRTGDLARALPSDDIVYVGRVDRQVKLRGNRVEPGEIEAAIASHPALKAATVRVHETASGDQRLVAYVLADGGRTPTSAELRRFLSENLPAYMIPGEFLTLDELPLTAHGKVNIAALPAPGAGPRAGREDAVAAPRSHVEEKVARIWSRLLEHDSVGVFDNFFEAGGHSLLAARLLARVRDAFGVEVPLGALFEDPTVAGLSNAIEKAVVEEVRGVSDEEALRLLGELAPGDSYA